MDRILKENGLEMRKLQEVDRFHPGFADCVLILASNPEKASSKYGHDILRRAKHYLRNKRRKADCQQRDSGIAKKVTVDMHSKFEMRRCVDTSMMISGVKGVAVDGIVGNYDFPMQGQSREHVENTNLQVPASVTYTGPVFNNCSFGSIPNTSSLASDMCVKPGPSAPSLCLHEDVPKRKRFKTAEELGLKL